MEKALSPMRSRIKRFGKECKRDKQLIIISIIPVAWFIIFKYVPMYGITIAFKDFSIAKGILGSDWVGLKNFTEFFNSFYFWRLLRNTLLISLYSLFWGFPIPIIFALLLNELRSNRYRKIIQSVTYFPHFVSTVVVVSIMFMLLNADSGILNLTEYFGGVKRAIITDPRYFRTLYIGSGIWQSFGYSSILYMAAIAGINAELYEAANIDGATRFQLIWHITLPHIFPVITIRLLLQLGKLFTEGPGKVLLMYTGSNMEVADIISTYVYRFGLGGMNFSFGTAVDLFNTVMNIIMLWIFNTISRKYSENSLW